MRLIDADRLKRKAQKLSTEAWKTNRVARVTTILNQFIDWIEGMPTIDAIEVVRCKNCKHHSVEGETTRFRWCGYWNKPTDEMRYCSEGERREP